MSVIVSVVLGTYKLLWIYKVYFYFLVKENTNICKLLYLSFVSWDFVLHIVVVGTHFFPLKVKHSLFNCKTMAYFFYLCGIQET